MAKYRKSVTVDAFRYGIDGWPDWFHDKVNTNEILTFSGEELNSPFQRTTNIWCEIPTIEGRYKGTYGDYIVKGSDGKIYSCKRNIFEKVYGIVEED